MGDDPVERRNDAELKVISERLANLVRNHDQSEILASEWRNRFCKKLDDAIEKLSSNAEKLDKLPCGIGAKDREALRSDIGWLQKGAMAIICTLFGMGVWVGNVNSTVTENTSKWKVLEPEHKKILQEVEVLKEMHQGRILTNEPSRVRP